MSPRSLLSTTTLFAGLAAALILTTTPSPAGAQGLIDFLWGGGDEWGGERQSVKFDPKYTPGQIIVSFGDRRLYHITAPGVAESYPIAVPREKSRWQGTTTISAKKENPSWRPTQEMLSENPKLPHWVPGGHPMNPLGVRALYLGASAYRIHGTDAPWTIGQAVSQGCIRMYNKDVIDLYPKIPVGTRVTVTWERFNTQGVATAYGDPSPPPAFSPFGKNRQLRSRNYSSVSYDEPAEETVPQGVTEYVDPTPETPVAKSSVISAAKPKTAAHAKPTAPEKVASVSAKKVEAPVKAPAKAEDKVEQPKAEAAKAAPEKTEAAKAEPAKSEPAKSEPAKSEPAKTETAQPEEPAETKTAAVANKQSPADIAKRAAEAAARAATAAQEAAEAARKAAAAAKKATSASGDAKDTKDASPGRRASL